MAWVPSGGETHPIRPFSLLGCNTDLSSTRHYVNGAFVVLLCAVSLPKVWLVWLLLARTIKAVWTLPVPKAVIEKDMDKLLSPVMTG